MDKMAIYNRLPIWTQNLACDYEGMRIKKKRYNKRFWMYLNNYEEHCKWEYEQLCEYRDKRLQKMIDYAYRFVPFYRKVFDENGLNPKTIRNIDELRKLPILDKKTVRSNTENFISNIVDHKLIKIHSTGGTTGAGLNFRTTNQEEAEQWAVWWRYRKWHGINTDTWCGNFGGKVTVPLNQVRAPFCRTNHPGKQVFYSGYHLNKDTVRFYVNDIMKRNIKWIHGYPSNIANFATFLNQEGMMIPLNYVSIGAENLYENQIEQIERAFGIKPIQHYGLTEGVANISEDPDGTLVVDEDFACVEFIPTDKKNIYRIIGTSLTNYAMPLLRYDTGDLALIKNPSKHTNFGRVIDRLDGRNNEGILLQTGTIVGAAALSLIISKFDGILASQFVQTDATHITLRIVPVDRNNNIIRNNKKILFALHERLGEDMEIKIEYVESLEKTKSGKQRLVIKI